MNSVERILTSLKFEKPDRVPVLPVLLLQGAKLLNLELPKYLQNHEYMIQGQQALIEKYGHDGVFGIPHIVEDIEPFGGELCFFESGPPSVGKMAWKTWDDVQRITNPQNHPSLQRTLKTIEGLAQKFKGEKLIIGGAIAPFSLPSMLIGTEQWFQLLWEDDLIRRPILQKVLDVTTEFCVAWCNAQLAAGADAVVIGDGMASATCIMREQFIELALPNIKETIKKISGPVVYEPVGHIQPFLDVMKDIGAALMILEYEDDIVKCKEILEDKMPIMGNLNNIEMITWDRAHTLAQSNEILAKIGNNGGYILSSQGPEIPWDTPEEVIQAIVDAAHQWE